MKTQKLLAKYVKVPAIRQLDKINSWANIFQKDAHPYSQHFYEGVNAHEKLEQAVEKAKADLRMRITGDGLFHYRYHPDKIPALVAVIRDIKVKSPPTITLGWARGVLNLDNNSPKVKNINGRNTVVQEKN